MKTLFPFTVSRTQVLFLVRLVVIYTVLYFIIIVLIGITSEGGMLHSPWLSSNLDLISGLRDFLLSISEVILNIFGYESYRTAYTLNIDGNPGIRLVYACMGFELICGYTALILAYPYQGKRTLYYLASGIILIELLNVIRISGLTILFSYGHISFFDVIDHHDLFNIVVVMVLIVIYITYLRGNKSL